MNAEGNIYTLSEDVEFLYNAGEISKVEEYTLSFEGLEDVLTVTTGQVIGTLPTLSEKDGYTAIGWTVDGEVVTADTVWSYADNKIASAAYEIIEYTITIVRANGTEETLSFTVEDKESKLAKVTLTADDKEYAYSWSEELPETLELKDYTFTEVATAQPERSKIVGQSLSIGANFTMNIYVNVVGEAIPVMQVSAGEAAETVEGTLVDETLNKYVYRVENISADSLAVFFTIDLLEGEDTVDSMVYSVETYLVALSKKEISNELKTLIADIVSYGQAAEKLSGKENGIQTIGGLTATSYSDLTETDRKQSENAKKGVEITSVYLSGVSDNRAVIRFTAEESENLIVKINGNTVAFYEVETGSGIYEAQTDAIYVVGCNDRFKVTISVGGEVAQTLIYSARSYVYEKQNSANIAEADYAKSLYNCSISLKAYAEGV